jgi:hypothetical protein
LVNGRPNPLLGAGHQSAASLLFSLHKLDHTNIHRR